ncbi:hypothetical protein BV20DRAFT_501512, partial [Pilatotrama ljubarskyi]
CAFPYLSLFSFRSVLRWVLWRKVRFFECLEECIPSVFTPSPRNSSSTHRDQKNTSTGSILPGSRDILVLSAHTGLGSSRGIVRRARGVVRRARGVVRRASLTVWLLRKPGLLRGSAAVGVGSAVLVALVGRVEEGEAVALAASFLRGLDALGSIVRLVTLVRLRRLGLGGVRQVGQEG